MPGVEPLVGPEPRGALGAPKEKLGEVDGTALVLLDSVRAVGTDADGLIGAVPGVEELKGPEPRGALGAPKEKLGEDEGAV